MSSNRTYLVLAIILLLLSAGGVFMYLRALSPFETPLVIPKSGFPTPAPALTSVSISVLPSAKLTPTATPSAKVTQKPSIMATPSAKVSSKPSPSPTVILKITPTLTAVSDFQTLQSTANKFQVLYSSARTLYQDKEGNGDRYTLYSPQGNFAIHVGPAWSWVNTSRQLSSTVTVAGQNTFIYEISTQKIVDFEANGLKYTIQCIHNNLATLKKECDKLLADFTLTK